MGHFTRTDKRTFHPVSFRWPNVDTRPERRRRRYYRVLGFLFDARIYNIRVRAVFDQNLYPAKSHAKHYVTEIQSPSMSTPRFVCNLIFYDSIFVERRYDELIRRVFDFDSRVTA